MNAQYRTDLYILMHITMIGLYCVKLTKNYKYLYIPNGARLNKLRPTKLDDKLKGNMHVELRIF